MNVFIILLVILFVLFATLWVLSYILITVINFVEDAAERVAVKFNKAS
jgi:hypothetical protein